MLRFQNAGYRLFLLVMLALVSIACESNAEPQTPQEPSVTSIPTEAATATVTPPEPTATVTPEPAPLPPDEVEMALDTDGLSAQLDAFLTNLTANQQFSGAVLIAGKGAPLLSRGYGQADRMGDIPNSPQTRFRLGSLTKQFTAMAVAILQERSLLDVQDPICLYLSECPRTWQNITVHQLLNHTSGIPDLTRFPDFEATKSIPSTLEDTISRFDDRPLEFPPGDHWSYSNSGYILLGAIIERASGTSYEEFLQADIFDPLGMMDSGYDHNRDDLARGYLDGGRAEADFIDMSIPHAAGGLYSTVEDMYRWDQALYSDQLVSPDLLGALFTAYVPIPDNGGFGYGYGWAVGEQFGRSVAKHSGGIEGYSAHIARYPDDLATVIVLSNQQRTNPDAIATDLAQILFEDE